MNGLSGFPCKEESPYDPFTTGHSSAAVSLALGLASARDRSPQSEYFKVVAVIGDGSLSGGLCFEGLNNAGHLKKDLLVVLNTNELSIAPNVGAISTYLNKLISMPVYNRFRNSLESFVKSRVPKGSRLIKIANKFEEGLKGFFVPGMLFEELGFRYFGPFDGHNLSVLIPTLRNIFPLKGPILLHVVTKKGKGYVPAEKEPVRFHSAGPFVIDSGGAVTPPSQTPSYTEVFSRAITDLAAKDSRITAVCAAMPEGTGLDVFRDRYPERFFDVGIAEGHAVGFAAGLARQGLKPVVAIYSTFLQRAYDQIVEEVSLQNLPVTLAIDRAGIVGEDGVTHQGVFDIAFLRSIPRITVMAPKDGKELEAMLAFALTLGGPASIRYPKEKIPAGMFVSADAPIELGKAEVLREGKDFMLISLGTMAGPSFQAMEALAKKGLSGTLVNARFVKPLDRELIASCAQKVRYIFTVEDGVMDGGFGSAVQEAISRPVVIMGLPCMFVPHGKRELLLEKYGLHAAGIAGTIEKTVRNNSVAAHYST
jgi:1-deoxy-D-xylulose-5-phosphate synthase